MVKKCRRGKGAAWHLLRRRSTCSVCRRMFLARLPSLRSHSKDAFRVLASQTGKDPMPRSKY